MAESLIHRLSESARGHLAMLLFSALVAGSFSLGSMAAPFVDPAALTTLRFVFSGAIVGAAALATGSIRRSAFVAPWRYLILGLLLAIYFVLMFEGLKTATAVSTSAVFTLTPLMAAGFGWVTLRQRTTRRMLLALLIGAAGAAWVIFRADWTALRQFHIGRGEWIYFWGCVSHALYAPMIRKLNRGEPALVFTFGMMIAGLLILTIWSFPALIATDWAALPGIVWITLAYVSIAASAMTFVIMQYASLRLPASKVMAYTYLTPAWVILWEIALGRGAPPFGVLAGVAMTMIALYLLLED
ncbi:DMT family transporter [Pseudorhodobacter sp.]|uniref:DMT family transporter n=1 Tax=Pseudorhodobacter sp. TaxID=1934400 RepID=UPI00264A0020|nr:DMT family transporter [Pseudorhodobacter sp.]MDN5788147.1 DMT family transporter [Pseudorhodobacter sp.]